MNMTRYDLHTDATGHTTAVVREDGYYAPVYQMEDALADANARVEVAEARARTAEAAVHAASETLTALTARIAQLEARLDNERATRKAETVKETPPLGTLVEGEPSPWKATYDAAVNSPWETAKRSEWEAWNQTYNDVLGEYLNGSVNDNDW